MAGPSSAWWIGITLAKDNIRDETSQDEGKPGPQAYERRSLCRPPLQEDLRTFDSKKQCHQPGNNGDDSESEQDFGRARTRGHSHKHESDADPQNSRNVDSEGVTKDWLIVIRRLGAQIPVRPIR